MTIEPTRGSAWTAVITTVVGGAVARGVPGTALHILSKLQYDTRRGHIYTVRNNIKPVTVGLALLASVPFVARKALSLLASETK